MNLWTVLFLIITSLYSLLTLVLWLAWRRLPTRSIDPLPVIQPFLTVIIVVRNEEKNISPLLQDLDAQTYPPTRFEVIVVDDHSTDQTVDVAHQFSQQVRFSLKILRLQEFLPHSLPDGGYKKKAIEWAVSQSLGQWLMLTDGDCRVSKYWLQSFVTALTQTDANLVAGPVTFGNEKTVFEQMQTVEFASLIGSGAATLQAGFPTMCNAANLAFSKSAFLEVDGYKDTASTATGDDLFLMHKIHARFPGSVFFLKNVHAIVHTGAKETWNEFYQQRKRWASKWKLYHDWRITVLAVFIFASNLVLLGAFPLFFLGKITSSWLVNGLLLRFGIEFLFLSDVLIFLGKQKKIAWIVPVQVVYFLYVVFFGVIAQKRGYVWKDRKLN